MVATLIPTAPNLTLQLAGGDTLDVRSFHIEEGMSRLFEVTVGAMSPDVDFDFEAPIGSAATFTVHREGGAPLSWQGVCSRIEQTSVEESGLSGYAVTIAPLFWLLTQRRNYKVYQDKSELDIVLEILGEWGIAPTLELDAGSYGKRRYRVQYAETDFHFVSRLLEDAGIAYSFVASDAGTELVLANAPNKKEDKTKLPFVSAPNDRTSGDYVTELKTVRQVRPGRYTQSDVDYRKALDYPLASSTNGGGSVEQKLERYHHNYGSFLWKGGSGGSTPFADDRGAARTSERDGAQQVQKRLDAQRVDARLVTFRTIDFNLRPGSILEVEGHPRAEVGKPLLIVATVFEGDVDSKWIHRCEARYTDVDYRPPMATTKPRTLGVESATVTGPSGEEIHTDEFGRIRVHFHWDRDGQNDETSSCWVPVNQPWAGAGFGALNIPRVGQEVLVDFLGADPDRPVVMGRVFTTTTPPPYELPKYKMVSGLRSETYPRPSGQAAGQGRMGGGPIEALALADSADGSPAPRARLRVMPIPEPVGGGDLATHLGGDPAPVANPGGTPAALPGAQPGPFGAFPAPPSELQSAITRMQSPGPDGSDHTRSANGVVIDDTSSAERVYIQAQKNLAIAVKADMVGSIGGNRAFTVLGNDWEDMPKGFQATRVEKDRTIQVNGMQEHKVKGDINIATESKHITVAKDSVYVEATEGGQAYKAAAGFMLMVGAGDAPTAAIVMTPTAIVIDAPRVFINPGPEVMNAIYHGVSPEAATAAAARQARVQAAAPKMADFVGRMQTLNPVETRRTLSGIANGDPQYSDAASRLGQVGGLSDPGEIRDAAGLADHQLGPVPQPFGGPRP